MVLDDPVRVFVDGAINTAPREALATPMASNLFSRPTGTYLTCPITLFWSAGSLSCPQTDSAADNFPIDADVNRE
jgi:hypothetical protein